MFATLTLMVAMSAAPTESKFDVEARAQVESQLALLRIRTANAETKTVPKVTPKVTPKAAAASCSCSNCTCADPSLCPAGCPSPTTFSFPKARQTKTVCINGVCTTYEVDSDDGTSYDVPTGSTAPMTYSNYSSGFSYQTRKPVLRWLPGRR